MVPLRYVRHLIERAPWLCVILLILACSTVSYAAGRQTAQTEGCRARRVFEVGHNRLVNTIDTLSKGELVLNPQNYPPAEIQRRQATLRTFVQASRVPIEDC